MEARVTVVYFPLLHLQQRAKDALIVEFLE